MGDEEVPTTPPGEDVEEYEAEVEKQAEDLSDVITEAPDDAPRFDEEGDPHDEAEMMRGFMAQSQRTTAEALAWYRNAANNPPFNPDGMCLKICRTARNIGSMYSSAKKAQDATPKNKRVYNLSDIRPGMIMYFDTVGDSNPYGHIVTVSVAKNAKSLSDITVWTNSVRRGRIVRVQADYFGRYWGDKYQFAATWLNGQDLKLYTPAPPKPQPTTPKPPAQEEDDDMGYSKWTAQDKKEFWEDFNDKVRIDPPEEFDPEYHKQVKGNPQRFDRSMRRIWALAARAANKK